MRLMSWDHTTTNHQPPTTNPQLPTTNYQPPTTNYQPPTTNHQLPGGIPSSNERVEDRVVDGAVDDQAASQGALLRGARALCHAAAGGVAGGDKHFQANEIRLAERPPSNEPDGFRGNATPRGARPDPVAEVGAPVLVIQLIQAA